MKNPDLIPDPLHSVREFIGVLALPIVVLILLILAIYFKVFVYHPESTIAMAGFVSTSKFRLPNWNPETDDEEDDDDEPWWDKDDLPEMNDDEDDY